MSFLEKNAEVFRGEASGLCDLTFKWLEKYYTYVHIYNYIQNKCDIIF